MVTLTAGERRLRKDKRFRKWRVELGSETPLRKVWTMIRDDVGLDTAMHEGRGEGSVQSEGSVSSSSSPSAIRKN